MIRHFAIIVFIFLNLIKMVSATELTHQGLGDIHFGKKLSSMQLSYQSLSQEVEGCRYVKFDHYPDIAVMVIDDIIHRVELSNLTPIAPANPFYELVHKTQSLSEFKMHYPEIEIEVHEYLNGVYLRWFNEDETRAIAVDYVDGKTDIIKAGLVPAVLWVEGCA